MGKYSDQVIQANTSPKLLDTNNNLGSLTGNAIKIIAIISMFIDHFNKIILTPLMPNGWLLPFLIHNFSRSQIEFIEKIIRYGLSGAGRIAFPLFCFLLAEGFHYTKNRKRYLTLMAVFSLLSEIPFDLAFFGEITREMGTFPFYFKYQNVFFTLFLGLCALWCIDNVKIKSNKPFAKIISIVFKTLCVLSICQIATIICSDYKFRGILFIVGFYLTRKNKLIQTTLFLVIYALVYRATPSVFILFSAIILFLYNGKRGTLKLKYFFYFFYPVHLFLIYLLNLAI